MVQNSLILGHQNLHCPTSSGVSERASEQVSAAERVSEASSAAQANERAVQVNDRAEERTALYSMRRFRAVSTHSAPLHYGLKWYEFDAFNS